MNKYELQNRHGLNIVGVLEKPEGDIRGTAVLLHGWGGNRDRETIQSALKGFIDAGFQVFNFDATNSSGESEGDYEKSTLGQFAEDFEDVTNWVQDQDWFVDPLAASGHSKGGYACARYAELYPNKVSYLVPIAPVISGELSFKQHEKRDPEKFKKWKETGLHEYISYRGIVKRNHWFQMEERLNHDLLKEADKLEMPILILVGEEDASCPPEHMRLLLDKVTSSDKQIYIIKNAPHSFYEDHEREELSSAITEWLSKQT